VFRDQLLFQERSWQRRLEILLNFATSYIKSNETISQEKIRSLVEAYKEDMGCCICKDDEWIAKLESGEELHSVQQGRGTITPGRCGHRVCQPCLESWKNMTAHGTLIEVTNIFSDEVSHFVASRLFINFSLGNDVFG
jgi:hypothetical protein